jgi:tetratricopeptide (TPR) repeat protein
MNGELMKYSLVFLLNLLPLWLGAQEGDIEKSLRLADVQIAAGDVQKALLTIEDILVKQPDNLDAQEKKINILVQQNRSKDAIKDIEEYILVYPSQPEYYYLRAVLKLQDQKYDKAIEDFDRAIQLDMPKGSEYKVYLNRGMAHFYNQDFDQSEDDFNEVIALNPKNAAAFHGKGMIKYELGQYEEAIVEFQKALKLEDDNAITHFNIAMSYFRIKEKENACYHFNRSCALGLRNACRLMMMECDIDIAK